MTNNIAQSLEIENIGGDILVDSRLIADRLGIQHDTFLKTIRKYESKIETRFGCIRFEIGVPVAATGNPPKYALLSENQATTLMTFSKNTDEVVECKLDLVDAFAKAKEVVQTIIPAQNDEIERLKLENENLKLRSHMVAQASTLVALHGEALGLTIAGLNVGQVIETKVSVTEVVNPATGTSVEFLDAKQLASEVSRRSGQKIKNADFIRRLKAANRDDLIVPVTRNATCEYVKADDLDEAISIVFGKSKQTLLAPSISAIVAHKPGDRV